MDKTIKQNCACIQPAFLAYMSQLTTYMETKSTIWKSILVVNHIKILILLYICLLLKGMVLKSARTHICLTRMQIYTMGMGMPEFFLTYPDQGFH
jgi:hypothetical protein